MIPKREQDLTRQQVWKYNNQNALFKPKICVCIRRLSNLLGHDVALGGHVDTVEELTDILVLDTALLLDVGSGLRHKVDVVAGQDELVLDVLALHDLHTLEHFLRDAHKERKQ